MYYKICPVCNANLDPGEKCDCIKQSEKEKKAEDQLNKQNKDDYIKENYILCSV